MAPIFVQISFFHRTPLSSSIHQFNAVPRHFTFHVVRLLLYPVVTSCVCFPFVSFHYRLPKPTDLIQFKCRYHRILLNPLLMLLVPIICYHPLRTHLNHVDQSNYSSNRFETPPSPSTLIRPHPYQTSSTLYMLETVFHLVVSG